VLPFLFLIYFVLAAFDACVTFDRIKKFGPQVELNNAIRKLTVRFGPFASVLVGIWIPTLALAALCVEFRLDHVLSVLVGARGMLALLQLRSLREGEVLRPPAPPA
jgi:hypothetical protein